VIASTHSDGSEAVRESNLVQLLRSLRARAGVDQSVADACVALERTLAPSTDDLPFLSVLVRTQGNRLAPLKDALLCLAGQTDQDFEVILLVHSEDDAAIAEVTHLVARLEPTFRERVRLDVVKGGARAVPLNIGLADARGRFVSVFDDDDLLMGHWVESFRAGAIRAPGSMVRSLSANQWVRPEIWHGDVAGVRTTSWPTVEYPPKFNHVDHMLVNRSPFMTWAFPRTLFSSLGLRFDEELFVCEDWDVIMQGAALCGVENVSELTSIYRRWHSGDSSYIVHRRSEWIGSEERVRDRLDSLPLLLPPGSVESLRTLLGRVDVVARYGLLFKGARLRQPLDAIWVSAQPAVNVALKTRIRLLRAKARVRRPRARLRRAGSRKE
jgi:glycosyltransferase involved in cell wall biosynthesis